MSFYAGVKRAWRATFPTVLHRAVFSGGNVASRALLKIKARLEKTADHDSLYDREYYARYTSEMRRSAVGIVEGIRTSCNPQTVIDVGCGTGEVLEELRAIGISAKGCDYSTAAITLCKDKGLEVLHFNIENDGDAPNWSADVVLSTEVAEHLPATCAEHYVAMLCAMAKGFVVITAAPPGQGGTDHVNEQPQSYWIKMFSRAGATFLPDLTNMMREIWVEKTVEPSRCQNVMVFATPTRR